MEKVKINVPSSTQTLLLGPSKLMEICGLPLTIASFSFRFNGHTAAKPLRRFWGNAEFLEYRSV